MNQQPFVQAPDKEISTWGHLADLLIVSGLLTLLMFGTLAFLLTLGFLLF